MEHKSKKTHWLLAIEDYRYEALVEIFNGFEKALDIFKKKLNEVDWYDIGFFKEETELIYGMAIVTLQNYINICCSDFIEVENKKNKKKFEYYSSCSKELTNEVSQIRLINELANYFKHKDENTPLHKNTRQCFEKLDLLKFSDQNYDFEESDLITEGLLLLCPDESKLKALLPIVKLWRDNNIEALKSK